MNLDEIWEVGKEPEPGNLYGDFSVKILSGIFRILNLRYKSWRKVIEWTSGKNVRNGKVEGCFEKRYIDADVCILDYDLPTNDQTWNRLNDHVKQLTRNHYIGKIYFKLFGKYRFAGYFSLTRV
jgi:hypothetical protein